MDNFSNKIPFYFYMHMFVLEASSNLLEKTLNIGLLLMAYLYFVFTKEHLILKNLNNTDESGYFKLEIHEPFNLDNSDQIISDPIITN